MHAPLQGITILDLTRVLSGPFATQQLVDLGAEVIKIEHPRGGDDTRRFGPPFIEGESTYFMSVNRGKKSVSIDLKNEEGRELVLALAQKVDVVIENFRPGTAERLGLGAEKLRQLNPKLITCSISGYGNKGSDEFAGRAGYDAVIQAATGLMALTGEPDGPPSKVGVAISDMVAGLFAAQGILSALFRRGQTGEGSSLDISMQDVMCNLLTYQAGIYFGTGKNPVRMGNAHPSICPYETVQTKDGLYTLAVGNDAQFDRLVHVLDIPWLKDDERFKTNRSRVENREALMAVLTPKLKEKTRAEWDELFVKHSVPGGPVLDVAQALEHPQIKARKSILTHQHSKAGEVRTVASPVRLDETSPAPISAPPQLGEHTYQVLKDVLSLSEEHLEQLSEAGAINQLSEKQS